MFTYILDLLLAAVAVAMLLKGHYGATRQLALAPLLVAALDATFASQLDLSLTPVLSGLLIALQVVILAGCALVLRRDRVLARNKQARRRRRREIARTQAAFEAAAARHATAPRRQVACA
ncbi:MAG: hypothetical protein IJ518_07315 [Clostridia bacterium]|nr:hypothetical protein [Clostridia bacterium]